MTAPSVLITGATGFVGSRLADECVRRGWAVSILARRGADLRQLQDVLSRLRVYEAADDIAAMIDVLGEARPAVVFHLASLFIASHAPHDVTDLIQSNVMFGAQLLEAMARQGIQRLVNTGTSWQHFGSEDYNPVNLYAATKQAFEDLLRYYLETAALKAITLKLFDTYGPGDPRQKLFHRLERAAAEGTALDMSPGDQLLDLVYIDDVVTAYLMAAERLLEDQVETYEEYAVSSGKPVGLRQLVEVYQRETGQPLNIRWGGRPYRQREVMLPWSRGKSLPGWRPAVSLEEGIRLLHGPT